MSGPGPWYKVDIGAVSFAPSKLHRPAREMTSGGTVSGMFMNDEFERAKEVYLEAGAPSPYRLKPLTPKLQRTRNT